MVINCYRLSMTMKFTMRKIYHSTEKEASYRILADLKVDTVSADGVDTTLLGTINDGFLDRRRR